MVRSFVHWLLQILLIAVGRIGAAAVVGYVVDAHLFGGDLLGPGRSRRMLEE
jgi:hypothetical protein